MEHAERNALYNACRHGTPLQGSIAIITLFPCYDCARGLIQSGIKTIITMEIDERKVRWQENWDISKKMLEEAGINIVMLTTNEVTSHIPQRVSIPSEMINLEHINSISM